MFCFKLPFACKKLHTVNDAECQMKLYNILWLWIYSTKRSPLPTERKAKLRQWRKYILRVGGGVFHVQYRGNVLLCPKSDESKKCLVLFYLFTLWFWGRRDLTPPPHWANSCPLTLSSWKLTLKQRQLPLNYNSETLWSCGGWSLILGSSMDPVLFPSVLFLNVTFHVKE